MCTAGEYTANAKNKTLDGKLSNLTEVIYQTKGRVFDQISEHCELG